MSNLEEATKSLSEEWVESAEQQPPVTVPEYLDEEIKKKIMSGPRGRRSFLKVALIGASIAVIASVTLFALAYSPSKEYTLKYTGESYDYIVTDAKDSENNLTKVDVSSIKGDFTVVESPESERIITLTFTDGPVYKISKMTLGSIVSIDSNSEIDIKKKNNVDYVFMEVNNTETAYIVIWNNDKNVFQVSTNETDKEKIILLLENIK